MADSVKGDSSFCALCNKTAHRNEASAYRARREMQQRGNGHKGKVGHIDVYACPHGRGFHIGHGQSKHNYI